MGVKGKHQLIYNSYGAYDAYKWIRKNKWLKIGRCITEHQFYTILRQFNLFYQLQLLQGRSIRLPYNMGAFDVAKMNTYIKFKNGKLHTNLPIDWKKTFDLWEEDEASKNTHYKVRREIDYKYLIVYSKNGAIYVNKFLVVFTPCRSIKTQMGYRTEEGSIEGFKSVLIGNR